MRDHDWTCLGAVIVGLSAMGALAPHHWCGEYQARPDGVIDISDRAWRTKKERRPG